MRTASPYLTLALVAGVGAMVWGGVIGPALRAEGGSADPHVSEKGGTVSNIGEQAEKIDHPGEEEEKVADYVEVGPTTTLIRSLPYNPPIGWAFNPFPQPNPWEHVDIHNKPPDAIQKRVVPPTALNDTAGRVCIEGLFDNASVPDWPLRCEGNLVPPPGGQGITAFYWSAKIGRYTVYLTFDDGPLAGTDDCIDVLKSENVKGTFLMVGVHMTSDWRKQQVRDAHTNGNLVGNHSYSHWHGAANYEDPPVGKTNAEWLKDFQDNDATIADILGSPAGTRFPYSRLPGKNAWRVGDITRDDGNSKRVADHLSSEGYKIYGWDTEWHHTNYTPNETPQQMVDRVKNLLQNGPTVKPRKVIVLMHDPMFRTSTGNKQKLVDFIRGLKDCGLPIQFHTVQTYLAD